MDVGMLTSAFAFVFGLVFGSFLNVCIHRIPEGASLVSPPSHCPACGTRIRFYDNIPVISYILLRGRCRSCGRTISPRYPIVELITGLLSLALALKHGPGVESLLSLAFLSALLVASFIDLQHQIIPDVISLPGILLGLAQSFTHWGTVSWMDSAIGAAAGGGFLYAVAWGFKRMTGKEGMGLGDVKLLAMIGAWMGWRGLPFIVMLSSLTGILIGGGALLLTKKGLRVRIPFGPFLSIGAFLLFFFGPQIRRIYDGLVF